MLPPGHIAAGFLVAKTLIDHTHPALTGQQTTNLLVAGAFFGFIPDIDMFYAFFEAKGFTIPGTKISHRSYLTHRPLFWLALGLLIFFFADSTYWKYFGLLVWLGTWSHFVLDSLQVGVKWLWPFSNRYFALKDPGNKEDNQTKGFFNFWWRHLTYFYPKKFTPTFVLEILILIGAGIVLISII